MLVMDRHAGNNKLRSFLLDFHVLDGHPNKIILANLVQKILSSAEVLKEKLGGNKSKIETEALKDNLLGFMKVTKLHKYVL